MVHALFFTKEKYLSPLFIYFVYNGVLIWLLGIKHSKIYSTFLCDDYEMVFLSLLIYNLKQKGYWVGCLGPLNEGRKFVVSIFVSL